MKHSIQWHKECLANKESWMEMEKLSIKYLEERVARQKVENDFYRKQIEEAIKQGKDGFDSDKFLTRKKVVIDVQE